MKKIVSISLLSILLLFALSGLSFVKADASLCNPKINLVSQDPAPATPGTYVKVIFEVSNLYNCNGYSVDLNPQYPFSLDPGYNSIQTISADPNVANYQDAWVVPYKIRVSSDALNGDYQLNLRSQQGSSGNFNLSFVETAFNLSVMDSQTNFDVVVQDTSGSQVSLGVVNTGKNTANSVVVKIPQQDNFRATGIADQIVGNLASGDYTLVSFNIMSLFSRNFTRGTNPSNIPQNSQVNSGQFSRPLQVEIDYTDGIGVRRTVTENVSYSPSSALNATRAGQFNRTTTSSTPKWAYVILIIIILGVLFFIYKRYGENIKEFYNKKKEKRDNKIPNWVEAERSKKRK